MRTAAKISRQPIGKWGMGGNKMIAITACAAALAAGAAGLLLCSEYEKKHFVTDQYEIESPKLPDGAAFRCVFLSDLHDNVYGTDNEPLVAAIRAFKPDAVLIGGDMMVCKGKGNLTVTVSLLEKLTSFVPVYYANGNHEERMNRERDVYGDLYDRFRVELKRLGVHYLSDRSEEINPWIRVTGCNLREVYYKHHFTVPELPVEEISERVGTVADDMGLHRMKESHFSARTEGTSDWAEEQGRTGDEKYEILLFHSPLFFETCRKWGADLTLCGHFHGGTIRIPGLGGVMTPQYQFFLPWCAGRFDADGKTMIVSRGLGTHSINVRLNDRPELVCVTVRGKQ